MKAVFQNVSLRKLIAIWLAEEQSGFAVADEIAQGLSEFLREIDVTADDLAILTLDFHTALSFRVRLDLARIEAIGVLGLLQFASK
jgi:hypothetical protein